MTLRLKDIGYWSIIKVPPSIGSKVSIMVFLVSFSLLYTRVEERATIGTRPRRAHRRGRSGRSHSKGATLESEIDPVVMD